MSEHEKSHFYKDHGWWFRADPDGTVWHNPVVSYLGLEFTYLGTWERAPIQEEKLKRKEDEKARINNPTIAINSSNS
jgi:hypothetical protein